MNTQLTIPRPDDWHVHLRDEKVLATTVPDIARYFGRAIVMPNLKSPITTVEQALDYRERILQHVPKGNNFQPLMTLYLNDSVSADTIKQAAETNVIPAAKLYPRGATTNSQFGSDDIEQLYPLFEAMQEVGMLLLIHGEVADDDIDVFDREQVFIDAVLDNIVKTFPKLRIVLEHISTAYAVDYIKQAPSNLAATITAHHLWINRNDLLAGGLKPHNYCLPIVKHQSDQQALIQAAISGDQKFFLGTDSAPHSVLSKQSACGCAGIYTAHAAIELYAEIFEQHDALDKLADFASVFVIVIAIVDGQIVTD